MTPKEQIKELIARFRRRGFFIKSPAEITDEDERYIKRFHNEQRRFRELLEKRYGLVPV